MSDTIQLQRISISDPAQASFIRLVDDMREMMWTALMENATDHRHVEVMNAFIVAASQISRAMAEAYCDMHNDKPQIIVRRMAHQFTENALAPYQPTQN